MTHRALTRRRASPWLDLASAAAALIAAGCSGVPEAASGSHALEPLGAAARGGSVAVDDAASAAYVADADNRALHRVDLVSLEVASTPLAGVPEQVVVLGADRIAVTLRSEDAVVLLAIDADGRGVELARAEVPSDPWGLAATPAGELLVTSTWGRALTALDAATLERRWSVPVAREPRGVVVTPDGARAFVTHLVGDAVTAVDLDPTGPAPAPRRVRALGGASYRHQLERAMGAGTLHTTPALAYAAALSTSGERLFVPHTLEQNGSDSVRSIPGAYGGVPVEEETSVASVAVLAVRAERALGSDQLDGRPGDEVRPRRARRRAPDAPPDAPDPLVGAASIGNPAVGFAVAPPSAPPRQARAAAVSGDALLVASQGTDELVVLDARAADPALSVRQRFAVGAGPTGVDVDEATRTAVVWSQHAHELALVDLDSGRTDRLELATDPLPPEVARGRRLFVTERDRRITRDGRACAGCHPEGRDDGVTWKLGAGPRQTPTLVGRLERGPFGWLGKHPVLEDNMAETITRLGGTGLPRADLEDLAAFLRRGLLAPRPQGGAAPDEGAASSSVAPEAAAAGGGPPPGPPAGGGGGGGPRRPPPARAPARAPRRPRRRRAAARCSPRRRSGAPAAIASRPRRAIGSCTTSARARRPTPRERSARRRCSTWDRRPRTSTTGATRRSRSCSPTTSTAWGRRRSSRPKSSRRSPPS